MVLEERGAQILKTIGMSKVEFARKMGIRKQNVNAIFKTKNIETIRRISEVMSVPFEMLIGYTEEPDINVQYVLDEEPGEQSEEEITPDDIPIGDSVEDKRLRQKLIRAYYRSWGKKTPARKRYNIFLQDDINIRYISVDETAGQASLNYYSTLAVLQLDSILTNARLVKEVNPNPNKNNQKQFEKMLIMEHELVGLGRVKMLVGVKRSSKQKVQYCITTIGVDSNLKNVYSPKIRNLVGIIRLDSSRMEAIEDERLKYILSK